ncbi:hypothetical protein [Brevibacillus brevis]|uniref:Uncharacterized protein n=1 Tax=Brevibacillus brevis TaxID=1393 RepID=A0A517I0Y4_BREBE|nr:hypothetical protein [Brevibacillus brevis]QDS32552.1 hypothetical protein FPS98_00325 [Brevibacillus brevis]
MRLDDFIHYYIKDLGEFNLVFKEVVGYFIAYLLFCLVTMVAFLNFLADEMSFLSFVFLIGSGLGCIVFFVILNIKIKTILKTKYGVQSPKRFWNAKSLEHYRLEKIKGYLQEKNIDETEEFKMLSELLIKESELYKFSNLIGIGILVVLLIPLWNEFVAWSYEKLANNFSELFTTAGILVLFVIIIWMYAWALRIVVQSTFDRKSTKIIELSILLDKLIIDKISKGGEKSLENTENIESSASNQ